VYRPANPNFLGIWYLDNSGNEMAESGTSISVVAGTLSLSSVVIIGFNRGVNHRLHLKVRRHYRLS
jgi:hypothetical protein